MIAMKLMQRSGIMPINNTVNILTLHHFGFFFIIMCFIIKNNQLFISLLKRFSNSARANFLILASSDLVISSFKI